MAKRIVTLQQADGTWHASLFDPESYPAKETSGTAFIVYALSWGINNGLLNYWDYFPFIKNGWEALNNCVHPDGKLGYVQVTGTSPDTVTYDDTEVYGVGAYLLAGTELFIMMYNRESNSLKVQTHNPTTLNRVEDMIEVPVHHLLAKNIDPLQATVVNAQTGKEVVSQVIYKVVRKQAI